MAAEPVAQPALASEPTDASVIADAWQRMEHLEWHALMLQQRQQLLLVQHQMLLLCHMNQSSQEMSRHRLKAGDTQSRISGFPGVRPPGRAASWRGLRSSLRPSKRLKGRPC